MIHRDTSHGAFDATLNMLTYHFATYFSPSMHRWNLLSRCADSTEFHGIPWNLVLVSSSMAIFKVDSCYHISGNPLKVEILRYHSYKANFNASNLGWTAIFHSKWRLVIYIYIYRERERERDRQTERERDRERDEDRTFVINGIADILFKIMSAQHILSGKISVTLSCPINKRTIIPFQF